MLGSFPPPRAKWKMNFYYPNLQNDMWRIFGLVFFQDARYFLNADGSGFAEERLRAFLSAKGIAISDTGLEVIRTRGNAADQFLHIHTARDIGALLQEMPQCSALITTGEKATDTLMTQLPVFAAAPKVGAAAVGQWQGRALTLWRLPSSSRAYPLALTQKAAAYAACFEVLGLLDQT